MPPKKKNYSISESDISSIEDRQLMEELKETYSIGGFDLDNGRQESNWDSDDYDYDNY